jgi:hypothetical protein
LNLNEDWTSPLAQLPCAVINHGLAALDWIAQLVPIASQVVCRELTDVAEGKTTVVEALRTLTLSRCPNDEDNSKEMFGDW